MGVCGSNSTSTQYLLRSSPARRRSSSFAHPPRQRLFPAKLLTPCLGELFEHCWVNYLTRDTLGCFLPSAYVSPSAHQKSPKQAIACLLPLLAAVLSCGFAVLLGVRHTARRRPYYAAWALGLVCFGASSGAESLGAAYGWSTALYRWWYARRPPYRRMNRNLTTRHPFLVEHMF